MATNQYRIGQVFLPGMVCNERRSVGNAGAISIEFLSTELRAIDAIMADECGTTGVLLSDVSLRSTRPISRTKRMEVARYIVAACYAAIGLGAFIQVIRADENGRVVA